MPNNAAKLTHYQVLGVEKTASQGDIKKAFHALALKKHPDKVLNLNSSPAEKEKAHEVFKSISDAYEILRDMQTRDDYDRKLSTDSVDSQSDGRGAAAAAGTYDDGFHYAKQADEDDSAHRYPKDDKQQQTRKAQESQHKFEADQKKKAELNPFFKTLQSEVPKKDDLFLVFPSDRIFENMFGFSGKTPDWNEITSILLTAVNNNKIYPGYYLPQLFVAQNTKDVFTWMTPSVLWNWRTFIILKLTLPSRVIIDEYHHSSVKWDKVLEVSDVQWISVKNGYGLVDKHSLSTFKPKAQEIEPKLLEFMQKEQVFLAEQVGKIQNKLRTYVGTIKTEIQKALAKSCPDHALDSVLFTMGFDAQGRVLFYKDMGALEVAKSLKLYHFVQELMKTLNRNISAAAMLKEFMQMLYLPQNDPCPNVEPLLGLKTFHQFIGNYPSAGLGWFSSSPGKVCVNAIDKEIQVVKDFAKLKGAEGIFNIPSPAAEETSAPAAKKA